MVSGACGCTNAQGLTRISFAKNFDGCGHLLLADSLVLLSLGGSLEALPGQRAQVEVHEDVTEGLQVVTSRLLCGHEATGVHE